MIDNRHCTEKDLDYLLKQINEYKSGFIHRDEFLESIKRFDKDVATQVEKSLKRNGEIGSYLEELIQNIKVDIWEHNK